MKNVKGLWKSPLSTTNVMNETTHKTIYWTQVSNLSESITNT